MADDLAVRIHDRGIPRTARLVGGRARNVSSRTSYSRSEYITTIVAILGTTISPYLFFWQASEEVEEERCVVGRKLLSPTKGATDKEIRKEKIDTVVGMLFCNVVFYFVILAAGATLHVSGKTNIQSAAEAAQALAPLAGNLATVLFAIGIIGAGLLAVPVLSGSVAYAVAETFDWPEGLDEKPRERQEVLYW